MREQLGRLGDSPFALAALDASGVGDGLFLPVSELNHLRQRAVDELMVRRDWAHAALMSEREARVAAALAFAPRDAVAIAMTHNPDLTESLDDPRVRLVCCGHTHGGQADLPFIGRPFIPSAYGQKYALGLVQAPHTKTFVTTGVGSIFPPLRFRCPPEVALLTLVKA